MAEELNESLLVAANAGRTNMVMRVLIKGADVNYADDDGWTALLTASSKGYLEIVKHLLMNGASVDCKTMDGATPLMRVAGGGLKEVAAMLIEYGANINEQDDDGWTPLHFGSDNGHTEIVILLINTFENKATVDCKTNDGWTPLMLTAQSGHVEVAKVLVELGASVNEQNNSGMTALHVASDHGQPEIVRHLIEEGASVDFKDEYGQTALDIASEEECIEILTEGADVDTITANLEKLELTPSKSDSEAAAAHNMPKIKTSRSSNPDVFLSYNHTHKAVVHRLYKYLDSHGVSCWIDAAFMKPGCNFVNEMLKGVKNAKVVIAFLSKNYLESDNCQTELNFAHEFKKTVIPVRVEKVTRDDFKDSGLLRAVIPHTILYVDMCHIRPNSSDDELREDTQCQDLVEGIERVKKGLKG